MTLITLEGVTFGYENRPILRDMSFTIQPGTMVSLLGPNGSGKTTLLKLLLGFHSPQNGRILLGGRPIPAIQPKSLARRLAYVPQSHRPVFGYCVMDVVLMGRLPHKSFFFRYGPEDQRIARDALRRLGIEHLKDRPYTTVSGGERQLVIIARALAQGADIFIMDEPVNGLDYGNQLRLLKRIAELTADGYTFIVSTHCPDHALWFADRVLMLKDGVIVADGAPNEVMGEKAVGDLYNTEIRILKFNGSVRVCLPRAVAGNA